VKKRALGIAIGLVLSSLGGVARAAVPADYKGTPYKGIAATLPGRIDFENFDEGGQDVAWRVDDSTANFGVGGCAANNYRADLPHPQLCLTNNATEVDLFSAGPMQGGKYPSADMPQSIYIGYTHAVDWVKLTVNVTKAGTYQLSSTWASEPSGADAIHFQLSFNDAMKADVKLPGTGGYHNWVAAPNFASVELEEGLQVLQFASKSMHLNYDYLQFSLMLPGGGVDDGSMGAGGSGGMSAGGAAGVAGATSGGVAGAANGGVGGAAGGDANAGGAAGTVSSASTGAVTGSAGAPIGSAGAPTGAAGTSAFTTSQSSSQDAGCQLSRHAPRKSDVLVLGALGVALALALRRSQRDAAHP
jgi:hypothetical protein